MKKQQLHCLFNLLSRNHFLEFWIFESWFECLTLSGSKVESSNQQKQMHPATLQGQFSFSSKISGKRFLLRRTLPKFYLKHRAQPPLWQHFHFSSEFLCQAWWQKRDAQQFPFVTGAGQPVWVPAACPWEQRQVHAAPARNPVNLPRVYRAAALPYLHA